jgi:hypothetical protein
LRIAFILLGLLFNQTQEKNILLKKYLPQNLSLEPGQSSTADTSVTNAKGANITGQLFASESKPISRALFIALASRLW